MRCPIRSPIRAMTPSPSAETDPAAAAAVAAFYDEWSERLLRHAGTTFQSGLVGGDAVTALESNLTLAEHAGLQAGDRVLDAGCGVGGPAIDVATAVSGIRFTGVTISPVQARLATARARREGLDDRVDFVVGDFHTLPFADGVFDRAVVFEATGYSCDIDLLGQELARVVRPGGSVFIKDVFRLPGDLSSEQRHDLDLMHSMWACTESVSRGVLEESLRSAGLDIESSLRLDVSLARYLGSMFSMSLTGGLELNGFGHGFFQRLGSLPVEWAEVLAVKR